MMDTSILWSKEKLDGIIKRDNNISESFKNLLKGTLISIFLFFLSLIISYILFHKIDKIATILSFSFILAGVYWWIYSFCFAGLLKFSFLKKKSKQQDDFHDMVVIVNSLQNVQLRFYSIFMSISLFVISGNPLLNESIVGLSKILVFLMSLMSLRMQSYMLNSMYNIDFKESIRILVIANLSTSLFLTIFVGLIFDFIMSVLKFIFTF